MLRISLIDRRSQRRLVLEGKLIAPWAAERRSAYERARADLQGRELVVEMKHITSISQEGENALLQLMTEGTRIRCCGDVFTKHVLKQLARRATRDVQETK
jgi:DNA-binding LacI/PurR family transcriptional regulator